MSFIGGRWRQIVVPAVAAAILGSAAGTSCIIPDHGIVALVDCGIRWCATAEHAKALDEFDNPVDVQEPQPDGSVAWRADAVPSDAASLVDTIRGVHGPARPAVARAPYQLAEV